MRRNRRRRAQCYRIGGVILLCNPKKRLRIIIIILCVYRRAACAASVSRDRGDCRDPPVAGHQSYRSKYFIVFSYDIFLFPLPLRTVAADIHRQFTRYHIRTSNVILLLLFIPRAP